LVSVAPVPYGGVAVRVGGVYPEGVVAAGTGEGCSAHLKGHVAVVVRCEIALEGEAPWGVVRCVGKSHRRVRARAVVVCHTPRGELQNVVPAGVHGQGHRCVVRCGDIVGTTAETD
jgi:hypothetical protein